jgi:hypothetical protein
MQNSYIVYVPILVQVVRKNILRAGEFIIKSGGYTYQIFVLGMAIEYRRITTFWSFTLLGVPLAPYHKTLFSSVLVSYCSGFKSSFKKLDGSVELENRSGVCDRTEFGPMYRWFDPPLLCCDDGDARTSTRRGSRRISSSQQE